MDAAKIAIEDYLSSYRAAASDNYKTLARRAGVQMAHGAGIL